MGTFVQIDALNYDFYPLQGMPPTPIVSGQAHRPGSFRKSTPQSASRISALEIAIRAQARSPGFELARTGL